MTNFSQENSFKNYFEIFDQPLAFDIDFDSVELKRKKMLLAVHPDKYVDGSTTQKRLSLQWTTKINEAYVILKDPAKRAVYLSMLLGNPIDIEKSRLVNVEVLEQQMELRDELADVSSDLSDKLVIKAIIENLENCNAHIFMKQIPSICSTNSKKQIMESYINVDMSISKTKTLLPAFIDGGSTICLIHPDILKLIPNENIEKKSSETSYMIGINGKISPIKSKVFITFTIDNDKYQHLFHECWKWP